MKLKTIFNNKRIIGLAGIKNSGKTNNIVSLIVDFRLTDKKTPIYVYGMPDIVNKLLTEKLGCKEISSLDQLVFKKDCIIILDEFQKLKLNVPKYKDELNELVDFVYHNNIYLLLSSPNIREFNSVIGGVVEDWVLKSVRIDQCINGSQLKNVVEKYKGRYKSLKSISVAVNKLLLINDEHEKLIDCEYVPSADNKATNKVIF